MALWPLAKLISLLKLRAMAAGDAQAAAFTPGNARTLSRRAFVQGEANSITTSSLLVWVASFSAKVVWRSMVGAATRGGTRTANWVTTRACRMPPLPAAAIGPPFRTDAGRNEDRTKAG